MSRFLSFEIIVYVATQERVHHCSFHDVQFCGLTTAFFAIYHLELHNWIVAPEYSSCDGTADASSQYGDGAIDLCIASWYTLRLRCDAGEFC